MCMCGLQSRIFPVFGVRAGEDGAGARPSCILGTFATPRYCMCNRAMGRTCAKWWLFLQIPNPDRLVPSPLKRALLVCVDAMWGSVLLTVIIEASYIMGLVASPASSDQPFDFMTDRPSSIGRLLLTFLCMLVIRAVVSLRRFIKGLMARGGQSSRRGAYVALVALGLGLVGLLVFTFQGSYDQSLYDFKVRMCLTL